MATTTLDPPKTTIPLPLYSSPVLTKDGRRLPSYGPKVARWIEANVRLGRGDYLGKPFRLTSYMRRWVWRGYQYYPETGRLRYKRWVLGTAKGNGKTPFEGALGAEGLAGPTAPVDPLVLVAAAAQSQANLVFGDMKAGITADTSPLSSNVLPYELSVQLADRLGEVKRVAAVAGSNDGPRASRLLADELHEWLGALEDVFIVLDGALKRADSFTVAMSTAGSAKSKLLKQMYEKGVALSSGELIDDETLFEWYEIPEQIEIPEIIRTEADLEQWRSGVLWANPALAEADFLHWDYVRSRFDGAQTIPRYSWLRYHGNRWTQTEESWLKPGAWTARANPERTVAKKERVVLAFCGTYDNETGSAGLVGCTLDGHVFELGHWEAPLYPSVPRELVGKTLADAFESYQVLRLFANPNGWHEEVNHWFRTWRRQVRKFEWSHQARLRGDACSTFYTAVETGTLTHDGSAALARHLGSAEVHENKDGAFITRGGREAEHNVELAISAVMAYAGAMALGKKRGGGFVGVTA